jgi:LysR family glycine cleavage system transcriptional activator
MRRTLPPLNPLRAFEVAGRHVSFTRAAEELSVTQTAVSRQVSVLESFLRVRLFERHNSELILTDTGRSYLAAIQPALEMISNATEISRGQAKTVLKVRVYLTFALRWLLPRLSRFREQHPEIDINLTTSVTPADFERDDIDISICHGDGRWRDVVAWQIFGDCITPVCAPSLLQGDNPPTCPGDLVRQNLLHSRNRSDDWAEWLAFAEVTEEPRQSLVFETSSLVYEAAKQGLGFAIGQVRLLQDDIDRGDLVAPFEAMMRPKAYYMLHRQGRVEAKTRIFCEWVLREAEAESGLAHAA